MKEEFLEYLRDIRITKTMTSRIREIYQFFSEVCPEELTDIFVSEFIKADREREYENVCFFSASYVMEAKEFMIREKFDMTPLRNCIIHWELERQDYNFKAVTEDSRFFMSILMSTHITAEFKASGENCNYLKNIFLKHIVSNMNNKADVE